MRLNSGKKGKKRLPRNIKLRFIIMFVQPFCVYVNFKGCWRLFYIVFFFFNLFWYFFLFETLIKIKKQINSKTTKLLKVLCFFFHFIVVLLFQVLFLELSRLYNYSHLLLQFIVFFCFLSLCSIFWLTVKKKFKTKRSKCADQIKNEQKILLSISGGFIVFVSFIITFSIFLFHSFSFFFSNRDKL